MSTKHVTRSCNRHFEWLCSKGVRFPVNQWKKYFVKKCACKKKTLIRFLGYSIRIKFKGIYAIKPKNLSEYKVPDSRPRFVQRNLLLGERISSNWNFLRRKRRHNWSSRRGYELKVEIFAERHRWRYRSAPKLHDLQGARSDKLLVSTSWRKLRTQILKLSIKKLIIKLVQMLQLKFYEPSSVSWNSRVSNRIIIFCLFPLDNILKQTVKGNISNGLF